MILWADDSQPAMRRPVRGHVVVFERPKLYTSEPGPDFRRSYASSMRCSVCGSLWVQEVSWRTRQAIDGPSPRRAVAETVERAVSRTPACSDALSLLTVQEVLET